MTSTPTRPVDNVVITTKGLQDRNINIIAGTMVENKGKLIPLLGSQFFVLTSAVYKIFYKHKELKLLVNSFKNLF